LKRKLSILFVLLSSYSFAQDIFSIKLDGSEKGKNLEVFLQELETKHPVKFYFLSDWFNHITIDFNYLKINNHVIVFVKDPKQAIRNNDFLTTAIQQQKEIEFQQFGEIKNSSRNKKIWIRGTVIGKNDEPLPGASVYFSNLSLGTSTDIQGRFQFQIPSGEHVVNFSFVDYEEKIVNLKAYQDGNLNITLEESPTLLEEVIVQDRASKEAITSGIGQIQISIKEIKKAPSFLGEVDLIKQIQILPGVTTAGEAASGFNVRGGSADQNLVLYDGMPVFNSSHVFGFFSAFNSEAIRDVTFYKGGIPAEFGGRISSILDIHSIEGDKEKWKGGAGVGIISSNFHVGGPIVKDKTALSASFRTTYSDWLINSIRTDFIDLRNSTVTFYDASVKLTHQFANNTKLTFSGYASRDRFRLNGDTTYSWKNLLGSVKLDHIFSSQLTGSIHLGTGTYGYDVVDASRERGFNLSYDITYPSVKLDLRYQYNKHKIILGSHIQYYIFNPGRLVPASEVSTIRKVEMERQQSTELSIYLGDNYSFSESINVEAGMRLSIFTALGEGTVYNYQSGTPRSIKNINDSIVYKKGETIKTYNGLEPRVSFRFIISPTSSIKLGYNRIYQYLHLVTNSTAITPIDIWQPSGRYFKPQVADQFSIGYFRTSKNKVYDASIEVYHKGIRNILDFKDGANLILNKYIETDLLQGNGLAYGAEAQLAKSSGRLTGSSSYTYSRSLRTIRGPTDSESINKGLEYASNFDQPHIVNIAWKYNLSRRYFFTGNLTYRTGRPVTLPVSSYIIDGITVSNFSERNQFRIKDYHRLDLAFVLEGNHKRKKIFDGTWAFSVYNVYGRKNPFTVFFEAGAISGALLPYQLSIIGTPLPSISYTVKF
jgi:hypothetical protein